ncbi:L,D-transpeptidase family protein [Streptomyces sp. NPDC059017]|uniref:L,D-transpeptidase family protein n=1 Tax=unclassified Streptomyces TaxID=2593676 RepID=UPI003437504E
MLSTVMTRAALPLLAAGLLLGGCAKPSAPPPAAGPLPAAPGAGAPHAGPPAGSPAAPHAGPPAADRVGPARLPGLGPRTSELVPDATGQAFLVSGRSTNSSESTATLYERDEDGRWKAVAGPWPARNALKGWTDEHWAGDHRSPIGVFGLTDAGGRLPDPGTELPYHQSEEFVAVGTGFRGEPLRGSFDYVVAINYNRESGLTPLDERRPMGWDRGGGVWIHVDHDGPTQGCVSLGLDHMADLLRRLDPDKRPVVVMGDSASLAR